MAFDRLESPGHVVNCLARLFAGALYRRIGEHGVNTGQFPVLLMLWEQDGVTQASLVEKLAVEKLAFPAGVVVGISCLVASKPPTT